MLGTKLEDKLPDRFLPIDDGRATWRRISMDLDVPYFLLRLELREEANWVGQTYLLSALSDVLDLCKTARGCRGVRIRQIAMVSPPWMGSDDGWRIHDLDEVKASPIDRRGEHIRLFRTKAGQSFVESFTMNPTSLEVLNDLPIVFRSAWYEVRD